MTKSGHEHIAQRCAAAVPRLAPFEAQLRDGSVAPDTMFGHRGTRHHALHVKIRKYQYLARAARSSVLCGHPASAAFKLGILLHYVADGAIAVPGKDPGHTAYEREAQRALPRLRLAPPQGVAGCRGTWHADEAAPESDWLGRHDVPEPAVAAERALRVSYRLAHAVFGPSFHPDDRARATRRRERRRAADEHLPALLRAEGGSWRTPWAGIVSILATIGAALGWWAGRGFWFWPALGLDRTDAAHVAFFACCAASLAGLALVGPHFPSLAFTAWAAASAMTFFLWAWTITKRAGLAPPLRLFWLISTTLLGPLAPVTASVVGLMAGGTRPAARTAEVTDETLKRGGQ